MVHIHSLFLVNLVILKLGKEKQLPTTSFPFQLHWFHYWPNWQNQLRPGCELRLISSPPSRLRSGLPEVAEGWLAPRVLVRGLLSPQLGAPSQGVSHCQNCSNFAQFFIHSMREGEGGGGLKCSKNRHLGFLWFDNSIDIASIVLESQICSLFWLLKSAFNKFDDHEPRCVAAKRLLGSSALCPDSPGASPAGAQRKVQL